MKRVYLFLGSILLAGLALAAYGGFKRTVAETVILGGEEVKNAPVITGMNSVLLDNDEIWALGLNGWKRSGRSPIPAARVAFLLGGDRLVDKDGQGWAFVDGKWKNLGLPRP